MSGQTGRKTTTGSGSEDGQRRVGQAVVVAICIVSLVIAGAIAPSVGSPFEDGPALNASAFSPNASALGNASPSGVPQSARNLTGQQKNANPPKVIGSPDRSAVGGEEGLSGFRNQSGGIQFVVQAPENTYYRVGAYQSFDGYGWSRSGETTAFSGAVPGTTPPGTQIEARVTLNSSAFEVPVPWKPKTVEGPTPLSVRDTGGIVPRKSLAPNQSFTVTAVQPTRDPAVLSETGYDYPSRIENGYVGLSDNVSERVVDLSDRITADASNPYEEARAIEAWLESNKEYSLNATSDGDEPVTRQFLFEMDAGYCQYFASSMAVMLRSQGIPARYVVGYAPGTKIGENTYAVTGTKAHAWVEVYFEDVGWVRFDPTPAAGRETADMDIANQSQVEESFEESNVSESVNESDAPSTNDSDGGGGLDDGDSTNETDGGNETNGTDGGDSTNGTDGGDSTNETDGGDETTSTVDVSLNRTASPGSDVRVTVTRDGVPVPGVEVYFNDEYVGTTDASGEVVAMVPYAQTLTIRVEDTDSSVRAARSAVDVPGPPGRTAGSAWFDASALGANAFAVSSTIDGESDANGELNASGGFDPPDNESNSTSEEFEVSTDMTFSLSDDPIPGETVWMRVSIDGQPVPSARVSVDGERVGETNRTGWVRVPLPSDEANVTVSAQRDEVSDSTELQLLTDVNVTAEGTAIPGATMRVTATYDGDALSGGVVSVDGERVGTTDDAGMATVEVPVDANGTVTVSVADGVKSGSVSKPVVTNATIQFEDPPSPGSDAVVLVRAANESVADASLAVDGETLGTTDDDGLATVSIPENATGNVTVNATLGSLSASRDVDLFEPNVTVTPAYLVALPGTSVTVNVTDEGEPVGDAAVTVGETEERTGENGTAEVGLPFQNAVTVSVSSLSASTSTRLDWLFLNLFGVLAFGVAVVVVGFGSVYNRGRLGALANRVRGFARRIGQAAMNGLFALASRIDAWLSELPALPALLSAFVDRLVAAPLETLRSLGARIATALVTLVLGVAAWFAGLVPDGGDDSTVEASESGAAGVASAAAADDTSSRLSLEAAWRVLVELVSPSRLQTRTPGEIGRLAVEKGLPSEPVETLTDAYRRAVYGAVGASEEDVDRARTAAADIERSVENDVAEDDDGSARSRTGDSGRAGRGDEATVRTDGGGDA